MHRWPLALLRFIVHRRTWYVLCWLTALGLTGWMAHLGYHMYDSPRTGDPKTERQDGNLGHTHIDYGGQWIIAHLFATGRGHELYSRPAQRVVVDSAYPRSDEAPAAKDHDADNLMTWLMDVGPDEPNGPAVGGPLYPPTHAMLFAPLGSLPPRTSYRVAQAIFVAMGWVAGLAIVGISRGRVWWPAATIFVMVFPGFGPALHLAQNSALSLAILLIGWWFVSRDWDVAGGLVWGLLAYKPVWAAAFILVPLLTRRWRMLIAMMVVGLAMVFATLPFVGVQTWLHWIRIGRAGADLYQVDDNWIFLSRDLLGIPRRWMLNFDEAKEVRNLRMATAGNWPFIGNWTFNAAMAATIVGWTIWAVVAAATAIVALRRRPAVHLPVGYGAAFVAIGAWATCFHFIYYDSLLAAFPVVLLLTEPRRFLRPLLLTAAPVPPELTEVYSPRPVSQLPRPVMVAAGPWATAVLNSFVLTAVALLIIVEQGFGNLDIHASVSVGAMASGGPVLNPLKFATTQSGTPWDTFILLALWAYCGARVLMGSDETRSLSAG